MQRLLILPMPPTLATAGVQAVACILAQLLQFPVKLGVQTGLLLLRMRLRLWLLLLSIL